MTPIPPRAAPRQSPSGWGKAHALPLVAGKAILLAAAYWMAGEAAFRVASADSHVTLFWPSAGIALAALFCWGPGYAIAVFAGALALGLTAGQPPAIAALLALGQTLGATLAAVLLRGPLDFRANFERYRDLAWFLAVGVVLLPLPAATIGSLGLVLAGQISWSAMPAQIGLWWFGDSLGSLIVTPVLLASPVAWWAAMRKDRRVAEALAALATVTLVSAAVLLTEPGGRVPVVVPFMVVIWATIRTGRFGGGLALLLFTAFVTYATAQGIGPISRLSIVVPAGMWPQLATAGVLNLLIAALISERDASVARARASEMLARVAVDDAAEAIIVFDASGRLLEANRIAGERLGYTTEELLGMNVADLAVPADVPRIAAVIEDLVAGQRTVTDWRVMHRDGSLVDIELSAQMLPDGRLEGVARDVTDRRQAADALRASEARLRTIVETEPECLKVLSPAGELLEMNPAGLAMIEADSIEALRGAPVIDLVVREHRERFAVLIASALAGEVAEAEFEIIGLRGTRRWMHSKAAPLRDEAGQPSAVLAVTRDVTAARLADAASRRLAERNEALVAALGEIVYEWDLQTGAVAWGGRCEPLLGLPAAEMSGDFDGWVGRIHPDDVARVRSDMDRASREGTPFDAEYRVHGNNGDYIWIHDRAVPRGAAGSPADRMIGVIRDLSKLRRAEAEQKAGQRLVEQITRVLPSVVYVWDLGRRQNVFVNRSLLSALGYTEEEVQADPELVDRLMHPADRPRFLEHTARFDRNIGDGEVLEFEYRMRHQDGTWRSFVSRDSVFARDGEGRPIQIVGSAVDVTERLLAQQRIRRLAAFPELNPAAVLELSRSGTPTYWNAAAERMTEGLPGRPPVTALLPDDIADIVRECLDHGRERSRIEHVRGTRTLACSFFPIAPLDVVHCYVIDVTDHVELRSHLEQAQRMESIGQLAGGVAHDFNNLLQVISGYGTLAQDPTIPAEERNANLDQVLTAAGRAADLTRQLLAFGRRQPLRILDTDLNDVVSGVLRMARRLIGENITVDFSPGFELHNVRADRSQIEQVLLNLCINARDAMPNGGRITIHTSNVLIDDKYIESRPWASPGRYVRLSVADTGHGMEHDVLDRIFEPFFTTKPKERGTGLGLAVVYGIVKQHDGLIEAVSEPDLGTTFHVHLPMHERSDPVTPDRPGAPPRGTETILIAEDDEAVGTLTRLLLERAGYQVLMARDGEEAIDLFERQGDRISLVLLDLIMPRTGGVEAFLRIRALSRAVPILFSSGYGGQAVPPTFAADHGAELIEKPFEPDVLLRRVREAIDDAQMLSPSAPI